MGGCGVSHLRLTVRDSTTQDTTKLMIMSRVFYSVCPSPVHAVLAVPPPPQPTPMTNARTSHRIAFFVVGVASSFLVDNNNEKGSATFDAVVVAAAPYYTNCCIITAIYLEHNNTSLYVDISNNNGERSQEEGIHTGPSETAHDGRRLLAHYWQ